jgi:hypothetical protein
MSVRETPMLLRYWEQVGGSLIEEFPAVIKGPGRGWRWIDGVILPDDPDRERKPEKQAFPIQGKKVVVVQVKATRLTMSLMGQTLFSIDLIESFQPESVKAVALCTATHEVLEPLLRARLALRSGRHAPHLGAVRIRCCAGHTSAVA